MVNSKRYKDEFGNRVIIDRDGDDFQFTLKYNEDSVGKCEDESFLVTRKDFEKMKELDKDKRDVLCEGGEKGKV